MTESAGNGPIDEELRRVKAAALSGAQIAGGLMIPGGRQSPAFGPVDCSLLIGEMTQVLKVSTSKSVTLKIEIAGQLPAVRGNPAQIRQLIMNLVMNASQAIGERKGEIRIAVRMATLEQSSTLFALSNLPLRDYLLLEVCDTGPGMTKEIQAKILDPFFTTKVSGRGLGLAVVQSVVRAHGGIVKVLSAPGSGTAFQILLPCIPNETAHQLENGAGMRAQAQELQPRPKTVLIIEDENMLRTGISKLLRKTGFTVIEAENGNIGVDLFAGNYSRIDLVLLDLMLPGKSGREVFGELQRIQPDVKVTMTSAYGRQYVEDFLRGLRPWDYIQKPYRFEELIKKFEDASATRVAAGASSSRRPPPDS
jgi:two-component system, cell cycle sensor histidine kinase and response regulator CckA